MKLGLIRSDEGSRFSNLGYDIGHKSMIDYKNIFIYVNSFVRKTQHFYLLLSILLTCILLFLA